VVGVLNSGFTGQSTVIPAVRSGLLDLGLVEGQTIALEIRSAGGKLDKLPALAMDLVQRQVDSIVALGPAALKAARDATGSIPLCLRLQRLQRPITGGYVRFTRPTGGATAAGGG
jgi:putative ABC transport system substrate-binding protein